VNRTGRGESIEAIIHICMETIQINSMCSYLYLKLAKWHVSCFIFYVFSSTKLENRRAEQFCLAAGEALAPVGEGGSRERYRRMNMMQTM
jgi:hypothetical protein